LILADTGAIVALTDESDSRHEVLARAYRRTSSEWILPWAILPEVDYLLETMVGSALADAFRHDISSGAFTVEWGKPGDLSRAEEICRRHRDLRIGLVDSVVMAVAERLAVDAIATLDLRHFAPVRLKRAVKLYPRDL
jgi:predicted nucleic acid-binding protein